MEKAEENVSLGHFAPLVVMKELHKDFRHNVASHSLLGMLQTSNQDGRAWRTDSFMGGSFGAS